MNMFQPTGQNSGMRSEMVNSATHQLSAATRFLMAALQLKGVGPVSVRKLAAVLREAAPSSWGVPLLRHAGIMRAESDDQYEQATERAADVLRGCSEHGIAAISILDDEYPRRLRSISDAPPILFVKGSLDAVSMLGCAVVGTREVSDAGARIARKISCVLARRGYSVISGLARGIDAAAHEGALRGDGVTIAILAHGLDSVAPASNRKLAEHILEKGGALMSEHEPGVPPRPPEFVRRNRLQSGMALCSIMVESGATGGSIHQARFTRDQGRALIAILPEMEATTVGGFRREGAERVMQEYGAKPAATTDDLMHMVETIRARESETVGSTQGDAQRDFGL